MRRTRDVVGAIGRPAIVVPERDAEVKAQHVAERGVERGGDPRLIHELKKKWHSLDFGPLAPQTNVRRS